MNNYRDGLIASATVVVVRQQGNQDDSYLEVLLLKRNPSIKVGGGMWVFPGGKLTDQELSVSREVGAKQAAVRECEEECGLALPIDSLVDFSRWITPRHMKKRFDTDFFVAVLPPGQTVVIDDGEIVESQWLKPDEAIQAMVNGTLAIGPPTMVSLLDVGMYNDAATLLTAYKQIAEPRLFEPLGFELPIACDPATGAQLVAESDDSKNSGFVMLYHGDAGYADADPENTSQKHRTIFDKDGVRYFRDNEQLL